MNMKRLLTFLGIAAVSASLLASCELLNCGNQGLQDLVIPDKAKPSEEMTYGSIAAESHAAHAVRYTIKGQESPYESVELFGDGTYLIAKTGATSRPQLMHAVVRKAGNGLNVSIPKSSSAKTKAGDEYFIVGGYEMKEEGNYSLEDFGSLKIDENDGNINLTFGGDFAHNGYDTRGAESFAGNAGHFVPFKHFIENSIADLVADLIGMTLGNRFRREKHFFHNSFSIQN